MKTITIEKDFQEGDKLVSPSGEVLAVYDSTTEFGFDWALDALIKCGATVWRDVP